MKIFYHAETYRRSPDLISSMSLITENDDKLHVYYPVGKWLSHVSQDNPNPFETGYSEKYDCDILVIDTPTESPLNHDLYEWLRKVNPSNERLMFVTDRPHETFSQLLKGLEPAEDITNLIDTCIDISTIKGMLEMYEHDASAYDLDTYISSTISFNPVKFALDDIPYDDVKRYSDALPTMLSAIAYQCIYVDLENIRTVI